MQWNELKLIVMRFKLINSMLTSYARNICMSRYLGIFEEKKEINFYLTIKNVIWLTLLFQTNYVIFR